MWVKIVSQVAKSPTLTPKPRPLKSKLNDLTVKTSKVHFKADKCTRYGCTWFLRNIQRLKFRGVTEKQHPNLRTLIPAVMAELEIGGIRENSKRHISKIEKQQLLYYSIDKGTLKIKVRHGEKSCFYFILSTCPLYFSVHHCTAVGFLSKLSTGCEAEIDLDTDLLYFLLEILSQE